MRDDPDAVGPAIEELLRWLSIVQTAIPRIAIADVEVAGVTKTGEKNPLAAQFISFMTSPAFQDIVPETNWMFPAAKTPKPLNAAFGTLPQPVKPLLFAPDVVERSRKAWVDEWLSVMSE